MRILVINLHRRKHILNAFKLLSLLLVFVVITAFFTSIYMESETYIAALQEESEKNLVIIDAGHGGEDPGAVGINGAYEKNLNLEIAFSIGNILEEKGFAVFYTRTTDKLLYGENENIKGLRKISDLKNRCKLAAEYPNAIFLSIHMNSYAIEKYSGLQVYYSEKNEESRILASAIQNNVKENLQKENNRVIKAGKSIYLLENTDNVSVLIECGFLTNREECEKLCEKEYQKQLSLSIVYGIIEYREKISSL